MAHIKIENKKITELAVANNKTGEIVFEWYCSDYDKKIGKDKLDVIKNLKVDPEKAKKVLGDFGYSKSSDIKVKDFAPIFKTLKELEDETGGEDK